MKEFNQDVRIYLKYLDTSKQCGARKQLLLKKQFFRGLHCFLFHQSFKYITRLQMDSFKQAFLYRNQLNSMAYLASVDLDQPADLCSLIRVYWFDWVEDLWPGQSVRVMLSQSVNLTTLWLDGLSPLSSYLCICAHSFARKWWLPFLNQQKGMTTKNISWSISTK